MAVFISGRDYLSRFFTKFKAKSETEKTFLSRSYRSCQQKNSLGKIAALVVGNYDSLACMKSTEDCLPLLCRAYQKSITEAISICRIQEWENLPKTFTMATDSTELFGKDSEWSKSVNFHYSVLITVWDSP